MPVFFRGAHLIHLIIAEKLPLIQGSDTCSCDGSCFVRGHMKRISVTGWDIYSIGLLFILLLYVIFIIISIFIKCYYEQLRTVVLCAGTEG